MTPDTVASACLRCGFVAAATTLVAAAWSDRRGVGDAFAWLALTVGAVLCVAAALLRLGASHASSRRASVGIGATRGLMLGVVSVVVFGVVGAEAWLRLRADPAGLPVTDPLRGPTRPDPLLGWARTPGSRDTVTHGGVVVEYAQNSLGYRDIEPDPDDPRPRVLLLGDSLALGFGVAVADAVTAQLRAVLPGAQVIGQACQGWGFDQILLAYLRDGRPWQPAAVALVWMHEPGYDLRAPVAEGLRRPWFEGGFAVSDGLRSVPILPWQDSSATAQLAVAAAARSVRGPGAALQHLLSVLEHETLLGGRVARVWERRQADAGNMATPRETSLELLAALVAAIRSDQAAPILAVAPGAHFVARGAAAMEPTLESVRRLGAPVVDARATILAAGGGYTHDRHPGPGGHRRLAAALAREISAAVPASRH